MSEDWRIVPDGSCGYEAVSPVLHGMNGLHSALEVHDLLSAEGAIFNNRCGTHIHASIHGTSDKEDATGPHFLREIVKLMATYEPIFYASTKVGRQNNTFCAPMTEVAASVAASPCACFDCMAAAWYDCSPNRVSHNSSSHYHGSRYAGLNLHSLFYGSGYEFRYFHATFSNKRLESWIRLVSGIMYLAQKRTNTFWTPKIAKHSTLTDRIRKAAFRRESVRPLNRLAAHLQSRFDAIAA